MKVYILKIYQGSPDEEWWNIHSIYSDPHKAEEEKRRIEKKIDLIKAEYENEFGRNYDKDAENIMKMDKEERWTQFYGYKFKHEELEYNGIHVNEHDVL